MRKLTPSAGHKKICSALAPAGWTYTGFVDGFYLFQTGDYSTGFKEMRALPEDLTQDNLALMVVFNSTR